MSQQQAYLFYIFLLTGILIGIIFDIFRILRKCFNHSNLITIIQDIIFFIITSILVLFVLFKYNNGVIRSYVLFGIVCGLVLYFCLFSKTFIKICAQILEYLKHIIILIIKILIYPFSMIYKFLKHILLKPISFIFINIKKSLKNIFYRDIINIIKNAKNDKKGTN